MIPKKLCIKHREKIEEMKSFSENGESPKMRPKIFKYRWQHDLIFCH